MQQGMAQGTRVETCRAPVLLNITASSTVWAVGMSPPPWGRLGP